MLVVVNNGYIVSQSIQGDLSLLHGRLQQILHMIWQSQQGISDGTVPTDWFDSLTPGRFEWNFGKVIFKLILVIVGWGISCETAFRCMSLDLTDGKSTLVQVMAWCCQATSHYLRQCWPRSKSPYGVTRPQWVKTSDKHHPIRWVPWVHDSSWHFLLNKQPNIWPWRQKSNNFFILTQ